MNEEPFNVLNCTEHSNFQPEADAEKCEEFYLPILELVSSGFSLTSRHGIFRQRNIPPLQ